MLNYFPLNHRNILNHDIDSITPAPFSSGESVNAENQQGSSDHVPWEQCWNGNKNEMTLIQQIQGFLPFLLAQVPDWFSFFCSKSLKYRMYPSLNLIEFCCSVAAPAAATGRLGGNGTWGWWRVSRSNSWPWEAQTHSAAAGPVAPCT